MFDLVVRLISESGYFGIFLLMAAENIFPPIPSELIMPLAGFVAARGDLNIYLVVLAGTAGALVGTLPWFAAGTFLTRERLHRLVGKYGKWLTLTQDELERAITTFEKHGRSAVLFGRLIPAIRTLISIPAGIVRMPLASYIAYTAVGSTVWSGLLAYAGFILADNYAVVENYINPVSNWIAVAIVLIYLYRVFSQFRKER